MKKRCITIIWGDFLKKYFNVLISAILAGIMIGIGGIVYLTLSAEGSKIAGAILFSVGLFTIIIFKLHLFTGKVGYLPLPGESASDKAISIVMTLLGNFIGTFIMGSAFASRLITSTDVLQMVDAKLMLPMPDAFLLAIPCGILMYVAVEGCKKAEAGAVKAAIVILCVTVFILSGFEHSIADMFYIAAVKAINFKTLAFILVIVLGNAVGGAGFAALSHYCKK